LTRLDQSQLTLN